MFWNVLVELKKWFDSKSDVAGLDFICISMIDGEHTIMINDEFDHDQSCLIDFRDDHMTTVLSKLHVLVKAPFKVELIKNNADDLVDIEMFISYLPYALLPFHSTKEGRCFVVSHFAQTLDGRIASCSGDSKWIGNEANLVHAHRMRALCDAILVGFGTITIDNPRLDVRLVSGENPIRVVIGGKKKEMTQFAAFDEGMIVFETQRRNDNHCPKEVLKQLHSRKIRSVYVEGGSKTGSSFLKNKLIDQVQIHISPKILGKGTTGFDFEGINNMSEAINIQDFEFQKMGDQVMFVGNMTR